MNQHSTSIALIGGGPAALLMMKRFVEAQNKPETIYIFEREDRLGVGMPYGKNGSCREHIANVSSNELPELYEDFKTYLNNNPTEEFPEFSHNQTFYEYEVIPRILLGNYLEKQFENYIKQAESLGIKVNIYKNTLVEDINLNDDKTFSIKIKTKEIQTETIVLCTGHHWEKKNEGKTINWYDSPYPPSKFDQPTNFHVAIRGTSLTAIDAVKTLARLNGEFQENENGKLYYHRKDDCPEFRITLFSLAGLLPALRFHSEEDPYSADWVMNHDEINEYKKNHDGFVDLNYVYLNYFIKPLEKKDHEFYEKIKDLSLEEFVDHMMKMREERDSFELFKAEYQEAEKSIDKRKSITWKEKLSAFSYAVNYPAKHFSAEYMLRLRKTLIPLITVIIAALPQSSNREIIALYESGLVDLKEVDKESHVEPHPESGGIYYYKDENGNEQSEHYQMFIDAIGQKPLNIEDIPFEGLKKNGLLSKGQLLFKTKTEAEKLYQKKDSNIVRDMNSDYHLLVDGVAINDYFQPISENGEVQKNIFIMSVPMIGGLNPDYSGLDFCDTASERICDILYNVSKQEKKIV